ncbi:ATP-binding protein, partial [Amaricoccus sp.]|uniref:ATP-binding protein n=1 Tax=Amaricoccus sp. TaxID=1872485 RepID=UPI002D034D9A
GGGKVWVSVSDRGSGPRPALLPRIFLPFWTRRADGTPGRGLGLSIVHAIVTRWKGRIEVQSTLGQGSSFILSLPDPDAPPIPEDPR